MTTLAILLIISSIVFDAISDAAIDMYKKRNHFYEMMIIAPLLGLFCIYEHSILSWYNIVLSYVFLRAGLFNLVYNITRELNPMYVGKTDLFFDKWFNKLHPMLQISLYMVFIFIGIIFLVKTF